MKIKDPRIEKRNPKYFLEKNRELKEVSGMDRTFVLLKKTHYFL